MVNMGLISDAEWRTKSIIDFKVSDGVGPSRTGPSPLEFNHLNVRLCPGTYSRTLESREVPVKETLFSRSRQKHRSTFTSV